jgi:hypothetical protein
LLAWDGRGGVHQEKPHARAETGGEEAVERARGVDMDRVGVGAGHFVRVRGYRGAAMLEVTVGLTSGLRRHVECQDALVNETGGVGASWVVTRFSCRVILCDARLDYIRHF